MFVLRYEQIHAHTLQPDQIWQLLHTNIHKHKIQFTSFPVTVNNSLLKAVWCSIPAFLHQRTNSNKPNMLMKNKLLFRLPAALFLLNETVKMCPDKLGCK